MHSSAGGIKGEERKGRALLAVTRDADILKAVVERLCQRSVVPAGATTWLVKIKAHLGEPLNVCADDEAGK